MQAAFLVAATIAPLLPTLRAAYVYDDTTIIRDNTLLRGWGALGRVWAQPYWPSDGVDALGLYRPFQLALLATVWNATGGSPRAMHIYAMLLAALAVGAVWWMLRRGVGTVPAMTAAAWFAVHPLHVEPVASVANTSELVVVLCAAALVWILGSWPPSPQNAARDWRRAAAVGALAAAALFAKESGLLALPLAALTVWGWTTPTVQRTTARHFFDVNARVWMSAVVGVSVAIFARLAVLGAPVSHSSIAAQGLSGLTVTERIAAMCSLWPRIAQMLVWPTSLAPYYGPTSFPASRLVFAACGVAVVVAIFAVAVSVMSRRGDRRLLVAFGWMTLSYFPASNLLTATGQILSDRALYGMTVGAAFALAWIIDVLPPTARKVAVAACIAIAVRGAYMSARYATAWTSHKALWTRLAQVAPNENMSAKLLGMDARARGDTVVALQMLGRAFARVPQDRQIRFEYAQVLYTTGRYEAAAATLAPLLRDGDARSEAGFMSLYLDAVGRSGGPQAVIRAATPLLHAETGSVAALFLGVAYEQLELKSQADSAYVIGLKRNPADTLLAQRLAILRSHR
ncbi:MAG: Tetratricopeptide 2 repeat protein [Gemmatimonadetes bacterium]|nr:Tetratricopeptide 2 repeat protein [Gemmatimonadota bacterium]